MQSSIGDAADEKALTRIWHVHAARVEDNRGVGGIGARDEARGCAGGHRATTIAPAARACMCSDAFMQSACSNCSYHRWYHHGTVLYYPSRVFLQLPSTNVNGQIEAAAEIVAFGALHDIVP